MAGFATFDSDLPPKTAPELASRAIRLALGNYRVLIGAVAVVLIPTFVVGGAALGYWRAKSATSLNPTGAARVAELIGVTVLVFGNLFAQAVGVHAAANIAAGRPANWRRSVRVGFARAGAVATVSLEIAVLCGLGLLLFILPGIYLWFTWLVAIPVVVLEGRTGREALSRSSYLVRGRWWAVFGGYLLTDLFVVIWAYIASIIVGGVFHASSTNQAVTQQLTSAFVELALTPIIVAFVAIAYLDLRLRKEGSSPAKVVRESEATSHGVDGGAMRAGPWSGDGLVGGTPPWKAPTGPAAQQSAGSWWPSETPSEVPDADGRPSRPPGWPALSPKPPVPGQKARPQNDNPTPGESGESSNDDSGKIEESR
ncbi:MAG TPA: glycerophosphoryl diester phosphodiesterase membrane domain-containing protein [Acidimicrobiales bacterium]|nr:glycerophosphoryl diester phosphodiesterase membrane domain-containing protein [Acidimicrobiales bacterium]